jgi:opacity protein-like surface antigen
MLALSTVTLAIAAINPTGDVEFDTTLNLGERHYIQAAAAGSEGSWYFKPGIAINMVNDITVTVVGVGTATFEFDTSTSLSLGFGVHIAENLRLEFGYFESSNAISVLGIDLGTDLEQEVISFVGLLDFETGGNWTPYVGAGLAMMDAKLTGAINTTSADDTTVVLCAGIDWELSPTVDFAAEYRFTAATYEGDFGSDVDNSTIFLGINWTF